MSRRAFPRHPEATRAGGRYDYRHQKAREVAARTHEPTDPCTRCGEALGEMGPHLHLDHEDDGTGYLGFAHGECNRLAGARRGGEVRAAQGYGRSRFGYKAVSYPIRTAGQSVRDQDDQGGDPSR